GPAADLEGLGERALAKGFAGGEGAVHDRLTDHVGRLRGDAACGDRSKPRCTHDAQYAIRWMLNVDIKCCRRPHCRRVRGPCGLRLVSETKETQMSALPIPTRFGHMNAEHAPGQQRDELPAGIRHVDFSHGDVAAFPPPDAVIESVTRALQ